jgi:hypothetical protein
MAASVKILADITALTGGGTMMVGDWIDCVKKVVKTIKKQNKPKEKPVIGYEEESKDVEGYFA